MRISGRGFLSRFRKYKAGVVQEVAGKRRYLMRLQYWG